MRVELVFNFEGGGGWAWVEGHTFVRRATAAELAAFENAELEGGGAYSAQRAALAVANGAGS